MLESVLSSPLVPRVAKLIEKRLGRPLEPFDIWYNGFRPRGAVHRGAARRDRPQALPDRRGVSSRTCRNLLAKLGFSPSARRCWPTTSWSIPRADRATPCGAGRRGDNPHLRTRVGKDGMDYKGYNIAVHEMGHNVEQTFSLNDDRLHTLSGVPNTAFTEALAFVFQNKDLELLGLSKPTRGIRRAARRSTTSGEPTRSPASRWWTWRCGTGCTTIRTRRRRSFDDAVVQIAKDVWNRYYAPVFGKRDVALLGVYAHMVNNFLYLPDYPIGHLIAFQIEAQMEKAGNIGHGVRAHGELRQPDARLVDDSRDRSTGLAGRRCSQLREHALQVVK